MQEKLLLKIKIYSIQKIKAALKHFKDRTLRVKIQNQKNSTNHSEFQMN